ALHLQRRLTDVRRAVMTQLQVVESQLSADDDARPADLHPATIDGGRILRRATRFLRFDGRDVELRVVQFDELAAVDDGVGNPDSLPETGGNVPGQGRFAVSGSAVQKHRPPRVDGRSQALKHHGIYRNTAAGLGEALTGRRLVHDRL